MEHMILKQGSITKEDVIKLFLEILFWDFVIDLKELSIEIIFLTWRKRAIIAVT